MMLLPAGLEGFMDGCVLGGSWRGMMVGEFTGKTSANGSQVA